MGEVSSAELTDQALKELLSKCCVTGVTNVVYTAVTGDFDIPAPPPKSVLDRFCCICFSDSDKAFSGWANVRVPGYNDPNLLAKVFKVFPKIAFPDADFSVWVDGNILMKDRFMDLIDEVLVNESQSGLTLFRHPDRDSIYEEARICIERKLDSPEKINRQIDRYRLDGCPYDSGLWAGNVIARHHRAPKLEVIMNDWWNEIVFNSKRDQISLPYVLWRHQIEPNAHRIEYSRDNSYFRVRKHRYVVDRSTGSNSLKRKPVTARLANRIIDLISSMQKK